MININMIKFDIILMFNVIENLSDPKKTLKKMYDLDESGYFVVNFIRAENFLLKLTRSFFLCFDHLYIIYSIQIHF